MKKPTKIFILTLSAMVAVLAFVGYFAYKSPDFNILSRISKMGRTSKEKEGTIYPRTVKVNINPTLKDENLENLSHYDVIVIDMEAQHINPEKMDRLREMHPDIKLLAHVTSQEIMTDSNQNQGWNQLRYNMYQDIEDSWWLRDQYGKHVVFWPNTWMINISSDWKNYMPNFIHDKVLSSGKWDGVFIDNVWDIVSWVNGGNIDINNDGRKDSPAELDRIWKKEMTYIMNRIHDLDGNKIVVTNGPGKHANVTNGRHFENFPNKYEGGYAEMRDNYFQYEKDAQNPKYNMLNGSLIYGDPGNRPDFKLMRYTLGTALLAGGYHDYAWGGQAGQIHNQGYRFDEYEINLGKPIGEAYRVQDYYAYYDDFEANNSGNYQFYETVPQRGFLTTDANEVVDGHVSVKGINNTDNEWNGFLKSDLSKVRFSPGETYTVRIKYKILLANEPEKYFFFLARSRNSGYAHDKGFKQWTTDDGTTGEVTSIFTLDNLNDYYLYFGIKGKGAVSIDNISITKEDSDFHVWRRNYENAMVLVNPTPISQRVMLNSWHKKIKGRQDPSHNDGKIVKEVTLQPKDAIILKRLTRSDKVILGAGNIGIFFKKLIFAIFTEETFQK
ncbi:MAG: hypothetical protein ACD_63C00048G0001 [uncultured bacterium]|nr:MAG: hypothetical protein ACD_63C00048G0001 [uncultured bacterium]